MIRLLKFKPFSQSAITSTQHIQLRFAGGTPKGKAKLKATGPLKRTKIVIKKGGAAKGGGIGGGFGSEKLKLEKFYEQCMKSPSPIRHLTPKQRAREEEREKLGLVSKARQLELDMAKTSREKLGVHANPGIIGTPGLDLITLGVVDADLIPEYELTTEDGKRLAKEYSRVLMSSQREKQAAESALVKMRKEAIKALPKGLRAAALLVDKTPAPPGRYFATVTPPIEGYAEMREATMGSGGRQKRR